MPQPTVSSASLSIQASRLSLALSALRHNNRPASALSVGPSVLIQPSNLPALFAILKALKALKQAHLPITSREGAQPFMFSGIIEERGTLRQIEEAGLVIAAQH